MNPTLTIVRMPYANHDVPRAKREYHALGRLFPTGFLSDWVEHARNKGVTTVEVVDHIEGNMTIRV